MTAILYSFRRCPYAMRARMALIIGGPPVELREIVLRDDASARAEGHPVEVMILRGIARCQIGGLGW